MSTPAFKQAISAGGKETMAVQDMFWGDRYGTFTDPFGHTWGIATHKEDLSKEEIEERAKDFWASMQAQRKIGLACDVCPKSRTEGRPIGAPFLQLLLMPQP